jgi:hypothetical protein
MITFKIIIDTFEDLVSKHKQLQSFQKGQLEEVDINKLNVADYPILFLEPEVCTINERTTSYSFNVGVMDITLDDQDPMNIYNNTQLILGDVVAEFRQCLSSSSFISNTTVVPRMNDKFEYTLQYPITLTPFTLRFSNLLTGWFAPMTLEVYNTNDLCNGIIASS